MLYGGATGRMASAEPAAPAPPPERAAALEREIARVQAVCAARASSASRLEAELGNLARRLSALRLQNGMLATENSRLTRESLAADTRLRRLMRDVETGRGEYLESTQSALQRGQIELALLTGARGVYTVQEGDSLERISRFFYRDPSRWQAIFRANEVLLSRPGQIVPGIVLLIPR
jgi:nucleoid-associated protein YgaU